jgi:chemosensory pili system protein ChpA (sensor histidine kinase/response regulator)
LRNWVQQPADMKLAAACMRTLHTLKGGARLAGAMRMGELAHRMETRVEQVIAHPPAELPEVEALQSLGDSLTHAFDRVNQSISVPVAPDVAPAIPMQKNVVAPALTATPSSPALSRPTKTSSSADEIRLSPSIPAAVSGGLGQVNWARFISPEQTVNRADPVVVTRASQTNSAGASVRIRTPVLDRLVNQAGEVSITRSRIESSVHQIKDSLSDLTDNLERLRIQLRDIELQAETQMSSRLEAAKAASQSFDPLEFDRFTRFQEITRMMAESVNDVATVQRTLQRSLEATEDELVSQSRMTRELQDDLLRTRMVEFEGLSDRLYRVARQAAKETGKQVRLDIVGGSIEVDRGILDRMTGAFEHLLRNCVTHGVELPAERTRAGKDASGRIVITVSQEGNEVGVEFRDDGAGLNLTRIRERGVAMGLINSTGMYSEAELANLVFTPGFSTAQVITELAGRGVGMDVVKSEVTGIGGRIETATSAGQGTSFKLILPLTTAVTQIVMLRCGEVTVAVPSTLIEVVHRASQQDINQSYTQGTFNSNDRPVPFFWLGSLLQSSPRSLETTGRMRAVVVIRSAQQRVALHVDEVLGNQEAVVKNLGPQMSRMPGLAGMTLLASGAVALIYNPVALVALYGEDARAATMSALQDILDGGKKAAAKAKLQAEAIAPLVMVVDDSLTVRRVTQRLLVREGYRVILAKDGLDALERLAEELPQVVLSDIEMPRMDGFDLVRNMRADVRLRDLPVIMITSRIAQKHRDYAAELGVNHYLGKPYSEEDLLGLLGRYTAKVGATQAA